MSEAIVAQKGPYPVELQAGRRYGWCACDRGATQPFCDGTHNPL
jgi:CDGSH-type Zn-finger protein